MTWWQMLADGTSAVETTGTVALAVIVVQGAFALVLRRMERNKQSKQNSGCSDSFKPNPQLMLCREHGERLTRLEDATAEVRESLRDLSEEQHQVSGKIDNLQGSVMQLVIKQQSNDRGPG